MPYPRIGARLLHVKRQYRLPRGGQRASAQLRARGGEQQAPVGGARDRVDLQPVDLDLVLRRARGQQRRLRRALAPALLLQSPGKTLAAPGGLPARPLKRRRQRATNSPGKNSMMELSACGTLIISTRILNNIGRLCPAKTWPHVCWKAPHDWSVSVRAWQAGAAHPRVLLASEHGGHRVRSAAVARAAAPRARARAAAARLAGPPVARLARVSGPALWRRPVGLVAAARAVRVALGRQPRIAGLAHVRDAQPRRQALRGAPQLAGRLGRRGLRGARGRAGRVRALLRDLLILRLRARSPGHRSPIPRPPMAMISYGHDLRWPALVTGEPAKFRSSCTEKTTTYKKLVQTCP